jgi:hypothetical protein
MAGWLSNCSALDFPGFAEIGVKWLATQWLRDGLYVFCI